MRERAGWEVASRVHPAGHSARRTLAMYLDEAFEPAIWMGAASCAADCNGALIVLYLQ